LYSPSIAAFADRTQGRLDPKKYRGAMAAILAIKKEIPAKMIAALNFDFQYRCSIHDD
jgi:hypothetical protein